MTSADKEFEKFREKKLNEREATKHDDEAVFFGSVKKKKEDPDAHRKMKLSELNIPGADDRPDNIPKVGEGLKLIDIALGNAPGGPPKPAPRPGARPNAGPPRPGAPRPGAPRPAGQPGAQAPRPPAGGAARPAQPGAPRPTGQHPGAPRPTGAVPPRPGAPQPPQGTAARRPTAPRPLIPPQGVAPSRPAPPPPGFSDRATNESERMDAARPEEGFEDTAFVEATEHDDPYEFRDDGTETGSRRVPRPGTQPPSRNPNDGTSGRLKGVKPQPPQPQPKKATTRRVKRGPLGR